MALWFTLAVWLVTGLLFTALYLTARDRLTAMLRHDLALAMRQLSSQIEHKKGQLIFEDETPVASDIDYFIMEANGSELASHGDDISLFDDIPFHEEQYTALRRNDTDWLLLDSPLITVENQGIRIRTAVPCETVRRTLSAFTAPLTAGLPVMTLLAAIAGILITRSALKPIRQVIACADGIAAGDLSGRVPENDSRVELGELSRTLNRMIASLEDAFQRERRFTSDASHELRTPVAVIGAYAEGLLADRTLSDESREKADIILTECRRMQRMIQQMLTLTRGQEGRYPVALECVCLTNVLQGVTDTLKDAAAQKQMTLQVTCESPVWLAADQSLLTQLFLNLVENAIKYGKDGGHVTCKARQEGQHAIITVCDDGIGIAPENLEYIFDRFFLADSARNRSGSGLGLSIVQWIVQLHHGQIQVESTLGKGSCFIVTLPLIQPQDRSAGLPSR